MNKRILIPTDFSKNALNAARYALDLYEKQNCDFYFLNVFHVNGYTTDNLSIPEPGNTAYDTAKEASEASLGKLLEVLKLHSDNPKHHFHTLSSFNFLSEAMKDLIAKKVINLVVMGTHGATGSKAVIFGSNTVKAMEKINACPVLAVPEDLRFAPLNEIVFPTDFKSSFKHKELNYLIDIVRMHSATVCILYIGKEEELTAIQQENKLHLETLFSTIAYTFHTLTDITIAKGITTFVDSRDSDMIAFINRKHFFFDSIFSKPLVKEIGYNAITPILALH
ncbi:universal stress protein [Cellulophaga sp. E16_2]|uniref:UspA domain-containing protein n=1 Tax=Cellulophaga algicola (strain DSM 14237 / IC166 / ACAM 630) TaxID=688270 RepID=E6XF64_CELAD|nr:MULTISPECIES: universal stress protein [Cellulophaga]ADV50300.1 UspA domain-containing protein [Cellulophaga algicola DSM 14237]MBO0592702.1 universal stress protein [Cellulophaga sp. E16_2]